MRARLHGRSVCLEKWKGFNLDNCIAMNNNIPTVQTTHPQWYYNKCPISLLSRLRIKWSFCLCFPLLVAGPRAGGNCSSLPPVRMSALLWAAPGTSAEDSPDVPQQPSGGCSYMSPSSASFLLAGTLGTTPSTGKLTGVYCFKRRLSEGS